MPPHVIFTRHADSPLRVIVPPAPVKYWDCRMTLRVPGVGKAPALRVLQLTFWRARCRATEEHSLNGADGDTADGDGEPVRSVA